MITNSNADALTRWEEHVTEYETVTKEKWR